MSLFPLVVDINFNFLDCIILILNKNDSTGMLMCRFQASGVRDPSLQLLSLDLIFGLSFSFLQKRFVFFLYIMVSYYKKV